MIRLFSFFRRFPLARYLSFLLVLPILSVDVAAQPRGTPPSGGSGDAAAVVNGVKIPMKLYEDLYRDLQAGSHASQGVDLGTADALLMQLIEAELLRQEAVSRKVTVTRDQAVKALINNPPDFVRQNFTDSNGVFQKETFRQVILKPELIARIIGPERNQQEAIRQWKNDVEKLVRYVETTELRRRLGERLMRDKPLTDIMIRARFFAERTKFDGSFIRVLHSTIPDSLVPVTERDLKAWYDTHLEDYRFPSQAQVGALILPIEPSAADTLRHREAIDSARTRIAHAPLTERPGVVDALLRGLPPNRIPASMTSLVQVPIEIHEPLALASVGDLLGPFNLQGEDVLFYVQGIGQGKDTVVRVRHMLVKVESNEPEADSVARQFVEGLKEKITTEAEFIESATAFGQDASKAKGGDLGYFGRGRMIEEFESVCFTGPVGQVIGPVKTRYGYHLVWITARSTTAYRLKELRYPFPVSDEAQNSVMSDALNLAESIHSGRSSTDSLYRALRQKYPRSVADTSVLKRLDIYGDVLATANFAFTAKVGETMVTSLPNDRLMTATLLRTWPSGVAPYEKIRWNFVAPHLRRARQLDMLVPRLMRLRDSMTADETLGNIRLIAPLAEAFVVRDQLLSSPPDEEKTILDSLVERTGDNAISGPVRGVHGYYFLRVVAKNNAPTASDFLREKKSYSEDYRNIYREELIGKVLEKAKEYAEVSDLRPTGMAEER